MYWTDVKTSKIKRSFLNGTGVTTLIDSGVKQPGERHIWQSTCYILSSISVICAHTFIVPEQMRVSVRIHVQIQVHVHVQGCLVAVSVYVNEVCMLPIC